MQIVKHFVFGKERSGIVNVTPIEDQINEYLENHPGYSVATMNALSGPGYTEAFVVFNVGEERTEQDIRRPNKQDINSISTKDYKNQGKGTTNTHNNSKT